MITIFLPAYNEEEVIEKAINKIFSEINLEYYEVLVIDDGSTDKTLEILKKLTKKYKELRIISHEKNKGLGGAIKTGIKNAKGIILITMDADMTHPLDSIPLMINKIEQGNDMCIASRYVRGGGMVNVPYWRVLLSQLANKIFSIIYGTKLTDLTSGYRAYKTKAIQELKLEQRGFAIQLEISVKMIKRKAKITEVPLILINREIGSSKFNFIHVLRKYIFVIINLFFIRWF